MKTRRHHGVDMLPTRRYLSDLGYAIDPADLIEREEQRLSTLCYLRVNDRLLLLRREKEPFKHHWTAPGGKIEDGEDPLEAVLREFNEETNLTLHNPVLKVICSELGEPQYNWLLFVFYCESYSGDLIASSEGELRWMPWSERESWVLPGVDRRVLPYVLESGSDSGPYSDSNSDSNSSSNSNSRTDSKTDSDLKSNVKFIRVEYDSDHQVKEFSVRPLEEL